MKVYTCRDFVGFFPVGTSAVVIAEDKRQARRLLMDKLTMRGLPQLDQPFTLQEVKTGSAKVIILQDGDY